MSSARGVESARAVDSARDDLPWTAIATRLRWLERAGALLLGLAGCLPLWRTLDAPFDRGFAGYQCAFFATASIGIERFGWSARGYPVFALDGPSLGSDDLVALREPDVRIAASTAKNDDDTAARASDAPVLVYVNHPPLVPVLAWASLAAFAPVGWSEAWRAQRAPQGIEAPLRLPFFLAHALALAALWWAARQAHGARTALIALALFAVLPVSMLHGATPNYESIALPCMLAAAGFHARHLRTRRAADLAALAACIGLGCAVTYAPLFLGPAFALHAAVLGQRRAAWRIGASTTIAAAVPLALHAFAAARVGARETSLVERAGALLEPLTSGAQPLSSWIAIQLEHSVRAFGWAALSIAVAGVVVTAVARVAARRDTEREGRAHVDIATPLLVAGLAYLLAFYRHTLEDQLMFLLVLAPSVALYGARAIDAASSALLRLRGGVAPIVVATSLVALPTLKATDTQARSIHALGAANDPELSALLPERALGLLPAEAGLGFPLAFYAWRNIAPISTGLELEALRTRHPYLRTLPTYLVLPRASSTQRADVWSGPVRALHASSELAAQGARFELWRVP